MKTRKAGFLAGSQYLKFSATGTEFLHTLFPAAAVRSARRLLDPACVARRFESTQARSVVHGGGTCGSSPNKLSWVELGVALAGLGGRRELPLGPTIPNDIIHISIAIPPVASTSGVCSIASTRIIVPPGTLITKIHLYCHISTACIQLSLFSHRRPLRPTRTQKLDTKQ